MSPLFIEYLDIVTQNFETKFSSVKLPHNYCPYHLDNVINNIIIIIFPSKICSVSVRKTSHMDGNKAGWRL